MNVFNFRIKRVLDIGTLQLSLGFMFVLLWAFLCVKAIGTRIEGQVNWKKSRP